MSDWYDRPTPELERNAISWLEALARHGIDGASKNPAFIAKAADVLADHVRELAKRAGQDA